MKGVVIVTGANGGIGCHMTRTLLEDGYYVAALDIFDRNLVNLESDHPQQLLVFDCDVSPSERVVDAQGARTQEAQP